MTIKRFYVLDGYGNCGNQWLPLGGSAEPSAERDLSREHDVSVLAVAPPMFVDIKLI